MLASVLCVRHSARSHRRSHVNHPCWSERQHSHESQLNCQALRTKKDLHARMSALKDMSERNKQRAQRSAITQWSTCASVGEGRYRGASLRFGALH